MQFTTYMTLLSGLPLADLALSYCPRILSIPAQGIRAICVGRNVYYRFNTQMAAASAY